MIKEPKVSDLFVEKPNLSKPLIEVHRLLQHAYNLGFKAGSKEQKKIMENESLYTTETKLT
jgi:hypothetical protein|tara:strand:- start:168 stop:350 length:183 start_codon:yes stop_codon:yes gene_type:complete